MIIIIYYLSWSGVKALCDAVRELKDIYSAGRQSEES